MTSLSAIKSVFAGSEVIDLAPTLYPNMPHWPTHPDISFVADARNHRQHGYFLQMLLMPEHSGCHVDAPSHVHEHLMNETIDTFPPDCLIGPAKKIDASGVGLEPGEVLSRATFESLAASQQVTVEHGDIVLVEFGWDEHLDSAGEQEAGQQNWWGMNEPGFAEDLCAFLAQQEVRAVGTDTAACDIAELDGAIVSAYGHATYFLPNKILIIEGLYGLNRLPGEFLFLASPLNIRGGSGSPIRPIALTPRG